MGVLTITAAGVPALLLAPTGGPSAAVYADAARTTPVTVPLEVSGTTTVYLVDGTYTVTVVAPSTGATLYTGSVTVASTSPASVDVTGAGSSRTVLVPDSTPSTAATATLQVGQYNRSDTTSAPVTRTLPSAAAAGRGGRSGVRISAGSNTVTVVTQGSEPLWARSPGATSGTTCLSSRRGGRGPTGATSTSTPTASTRPRTGRCSTATPSRRGS